MTSLQISHTLGETNKCADFLINFETTTITLEMRLNSVLIKDNNFIQYKVYHKFKKIYILESSTDKK